MRHSHYLFSFDGSRCWGELRFHPNLAAGSILGLGSRVQVGVVKSISLRNLVQKPRNMLELFVWKELRQSIIFVLFFNTSLAM